MVIMVVVSEGTIGMVIMVVTGMIAVSLTVAVKMVVAVGAEISWESSLMES
jgi:hypothetical protein